MKILCLLLPALLLCGCSLPNDVCYHKAQLYLGSDDYTTAADMFTSLGEYADAADYALYCQGLAAMERGEISLAQADMGLVHPFKSSGRYLQYLSARQKEAEGQLSQALVAYRAMGTFEDSCQRAESLQEEIPRQQRARAMGLMRAGRWEQAAAILTPLDDGDSQTLLEECRRQAQQAAYDQASRLYSTGRYGEAMAAFEALGDVLDASARARICRSAMYAQLEEDYASASMTNARQLMERYAEMEDYFASPLRLQTLQERFAVNLLIANADKPYVRFAGQVWQVQHVAGSMALLARPTGGGITLTRAEEAAVIARDATHLTLNLDRFAFTRGSGTAEEPYE